MTMRLNPLAPWLLCLSLALLVALAAAAVVWSLRGDPRSETRSTTRPATLIIVDRQHPQRFRIRSHPVSTQLLAAVLAGSLDRQLAAGRSPESTWLLAARAQRLASPVNCRKLREDFERLSDPGRQRHRRPSPHIAACSDRLSAAQPELRQLLGTLASPQPIAARGVATASLLLSDGSGPLFDRHSSVDLRDALRQAIEQLDPTSAMAAWN